MFVNAMILLPGETAGEWWGAPGSDGRRLYAGGGVAMTSGDSFLMNDSVILPVFDDRVYRFDGFTGYGGLSTQGWPSAPIRPCTEALVVARASGPKQGVRIYVGSLDGLIYELDNGGKTLSSFPLLPAIGVGDQAKHVFGLAFHNEVIYAVQGYRLFAHGLDTGPLWTFDLEKSELRLEKN